MASRYEIATGKLPKIPPETHKVRPAPRPEARPKPRVIRDVARTIVEYDDSPRMAVRIRPEASPRTRVGNETVRREPVRMITDEEVREMDVNASDQVQLTPEDIAKLSKLWK